MRILKLRCKFCGYWNRVPVNKVLVEQPSTKPEAKVFIPIYVKLCNISGLESYCEI